MSERLERIAAEIAKARKRREQMNVKVKELEEKYREVKNTEIQDIVAKAALTPEALEILIMQSRQALPQTEGNRLNEEKADSASVETQKEVEDEDI